MMSRKEVPRAGLVKASSHRITTRPCPIPKDTNAIAAVVDHGGNRHNGERRARPERSGGEACGQPAVIGEALQRVADTRAVDDARANPAHQPPAYSMTSELAPALINHAAPTRPPMATSSRGPKRSTK